VNPQALQSYRINKFHFFYGVYMKRKCSDQWPGDENSHLIQNACEMADMSASLSNILSVTPVSTPDVTYTNVFCAICNNHNVSEYVYWKPGLYCGNDSDFLSGSGSVNWKKVEQLCSIAFFEQPNVTLRWLDPLRPCISENFVDKCLEYDHTGKTMSEGEYSCTANWCESYTDYLYESPDFTSFTTVYKNIHCAICNGANVNQLICERVKEKVTCPDCKHIIAMLTFGDMGEISYKTGEVVELVTETCSQQQVYDLGQMRCHDLVCAPGFKLLEGVCNQTRPNQTRPNRIFMEFPLNLTLASYGTAEKLQNITKPGNVDSFYYVLQTKLKQFVVNGTITVISVVPDGNHLHIQLSISMVNDSNIIQETFLKLNSMSLLFYYNDVLFQTFTVGTPTSISTTSSHTSLAANLVCNQYTSLNKSEYELFENKTVLVTATNRLLHQSNYTIITGNLLYCKDLTESTDNNITPRTNVAKRLSYKMVTILSVFIGTRAFLSI
jgi:hypothetical protein